MADRFEAFRDVELSLPELISAAQRLTRQAKVRAGDGRVAAALDERVVRYYQTLNLLRKPHGYAGRRAVYGFHHLLQLVCIRALQADGRPLALIQETLTGQTTGQLEDSVRRLLELPPGPAPAHPRELVAAELAPGISVLIDPEQVADPQQALGRLRAALLASTAE